MISYDSSEIINIGTGQDLTIKDLTELISIIIVNRIVIDFRIYFWKY